MADASFRYADNREAIQEGDAQSFGGTIKILQGEVANATTHLAIEGATRAAYDCNISRAGRGLIVLLEASSIYTVTTAEDKTRAAAREGAVNSAGIGGGIAGGAAAGLVCGPGAQVCVTVGAFVGGALAAFGVDMLF